MKLILGFGLALFKHEYAQRNLPSELLHHLHTDTQDGTALVGGGVGELSLEARHPGTEVARLRNDRHFVLVVGDDLGKFILDVLGVEGLATHAAESVGSLVELAFLDPVTRRLGQQSKTNGQDDSPKKLHGDGDTVGSSVAAVLGGVYNAVGKQNTDGDAELIASDNGTTDLAGSDLRHVAAFISGCLTRRWSWVDLQNNDGRDETNTKTSDETASNHDVETSGSNLKDTANGEDGAAENDGHATTDEVGEVTSDDGTKESTGRQDGGGKGLLPRWDTELLVAVYLDVGSGSIWSKSNVRVVVASVLLDEEVHVQDTSHPAGIIAEEDATESCESNNQVSADGDWGLDAIDIGRAGDGDSTTTRHVC